MSSPPAACSGRTELSLPISTTMHGPSTRPLTASLLSRSTFFPCSWPAKDPVGNFRTHGHHLSSAALNGKGKRQNETLPPDLYTCNVFVCHFIFILDSSPLPWWTLEPCREGKTRRDGKQAKPQLLYRSFWNNKEGQMHGQAFFTSIFETLRLANRFIFPPVFFDFVSSVLGSLLLLLTLCILPFTEKGAGEGYSEAERASERDGWT